MFLNGIEQTFVRLRECRLFASARGWPTFDLKTPRPRLLCVYDSTSPPPKQPQPPFSAALSFFLLLPGFYLLDLLTHVVVKWEGTQHYYTLCMWVRLEGSASHNTLSPRVTLLLLPR